MQMFDLNGCTALATGASMGIGFALAPASEALRCAGASVHTLVFDVTDHEAAAVSPGGCGPPREGPGWAAAPNVG